MCGMESKANGSTPIAGLDVKRKYEESRVFGGGGLDYKRL